jgi:hypothetical protein
VYNALLRKSYHDFTAKRASYLEEFEMWLSAPGMMDG